MNAARRKNLEALAQRIESLRQEVEELRDEEQESFDNMPDSLQDGDKGQAADAAIQRLDESCLCLDQAIDEIRQSIEN